ncbi:hypothetical protein H5410_014762 [Solanum commersonii]|uniref:Uncharacterized protein n=1 Tax=Solanum commersonii TaxID=4109 RepID=A0A9J5ZSD2_SOLCO|nr:hypothetical protein H5410_014762 [Solanum commersonii]
MGRLHLTSADLCVQSKGDAGKPRPTTTNMPLAVVAFLKRTFHVIYVQKSADADCHWPTTMLPSRCAHATADACRH